MDMHDGVQGGNWGALPDGDGHWAFGLWHPDAKEVLVEIGNRKIAAQRQDDGFFRARIRAEAGEAYRYVVDGRAIPDPASRLLASGVHGASRLHDPRAHRWTTAWSGRPWHEAVIYELHIGTFTDAGTFRAAQARLPELAALGFTAVEIMPVAQFAGNRGWGYDGVQLFAPHTAYGTPDDLQDLVEAAQSLGMMVILDVVYNHFGPEGMYLCDAFFDEEAQTPWGQGLNYRQSAVRSYILENAVMWVRDYRFDGLRLDAVPQIVDDSDPSIVVELAQTLRALDLDRPIHLVTEDERNVPDLRDNGLFNADWNDDYHHAMHVLLTGEEHSYYAPFAVDPMGDLVKALREGQVRQGQPRTGDAPPGAPVGHLPWIAFVNTNQNHDQIGNRPRGERLLTLAEPQAVEVAMAMLLLAPFIPLVFMGEEVGATAPFLFFAEHSGDLAASASAGRVAEVGGEASAFPDPYAWETFVASRPFAVPSPDADAWRRLTADLLAVRRSVIVPLLASGAAHKAQCVQTGPRALTATWPFQGATVTMHANLGSPPDATPSTEGSVYALRDVARDAYAVCLTVNR